MKIWVTFLLIIECVYLSYCLASFLRGTMTIGGVLVMFGVLVMTVIGCGALLVLSAPREPDESEIDPWGDKFE